MDTVADVPIHNYRLRHLQTEDLKDGEDPDVARLSRKQDDGSEFDWVLVFRQGVNDQDLVKFCGGDVGQGACKAMGHPSSKGVRFVTMRGTEAKLTEKLKAHPSVVEFVEPDLPVFPIPEIPSVADAESYDLWGLDKIGISRATATGKGVHIYVMDTGVRTTHSDFGGRAVPTLDTIAGGGTPVECNGDPTCAADTHSHGTHCAGTAGGTKFGAAKEATIHAMKVCCGYGTNTIAGMDWVAVKGERPAILTMSLGSYGQSQAAKVAVDNLVSQGVTVFVSSGNNNIDACGKTYAFIESAIVVGASTPEDARASFSNWGPCNTIYAPGTGILSASHKDDDGTRYMTGTSMATPLAAGVGAMLLSENPTMSPAALRAKLLETAKSGVLTGLKGDPNVLLNIP